MRTSDLDGSGRDETIVCGRPGGQLITTPFWPARRGPEGTPGACRARARKQEDPGPHPRGPEPGLGNQRLNVCVRVARCGAHVCPWAVYSWIQRGKQAFLGTLTCVDMKMGLCTRAHGYGSECMELMCEKTGMEVCVWAWKHTCRGLHVENCRGLCEDPKACAFRMWMWEQPGTGLGVRDLDRLVLQSICVHG